MKRTLLALSAATVLAMSGTAFAQGHGGGHAAPQASTAGAAHANTGMSTRSMAPTTRTSPTTSAAPTTTTLRGPEHTGQPGVECGEEGALNTPGNSATASGSPFNESGTAGQHYAGEQPQNSRNTASVSQYDSACAHVPG